MPNQQCQSTEANAVALSLLQNKFIVTKCFDTIGWEAEKSSDM